MLHPPRVCFGSVFQKPDNISLQKEVLLCTSMSQTFKHCEFLRAWQAPFRETPKLPTLEQADSNSNLDFAGVRSQPHS